MNSKERHEARYQRRKQKREKKRMEVAKEYGDFNTVFTFDHLYNSYKNCCLGVGWKASTQRYKSNALANVNDTLNLLQNNNYKSKGFYEFDIVERGKLRHIKSVHISERIVQRCLCDYSLVPMFERSFIYDNGACMRNKGIDFAVNRFTCHLQRHWRKYGNSGYVLLFDFSRYFDNIQHEPLKQIVDKYYMGERIKTLIKQFIDDFGDIGLGLGSQISQVSALMYPNKLDHYIKEILHVKGYGRYMDDGYLIHESKKYLQKCLVEIRQICGELGIKLNTKKTQIVKMSKGVNFLKSKFIFNDTGKVIRKPNHKSIKKMRHKLKTFKKWQTESRMTIDAIKRSYESWKGHLKHFNAYSIIVRIDEVFNNLFEDKI